MNNQVEKAWSRLDALQKQVVQAFPVGPQPIALVSSNGQQCPVKFLHRKDGFFLDIPDDKKRNWQNEFVLPWLFRNPGAALVQGTVAVIV